MGHATEDRHEENGSRRPVLHLGSVSALCHPRRGLLLLWAWLEDITIGAAWLEDITIGAVVSELEDITIGKGGDIVPG